MKICAIICEYNPLHDGHLYQIAEAKRRSGADALLCLMSGNFVQRGSAAVLDKHTRARHALLAGADIVVELPSPFATSNAELFAKGAIHILSSIPNVDTLCFGAEREDKQEFLRAAALLNDEPKRVSERVKSLVKQGVSYAKARATAWEDELPASLLTSPNCILGIEYARAILAVDAPIEILPVLRKGAGYKQTTRDGFPSSTSLREGIANGDDLRGLPDYVRTDLPSALEQRLDGLEKYAILRNTTEEIAAVCDCTEGLENAFKRAASKAPPLVEQLTSARYTSSRIRRIALQNLLGITEELIRSSLSSPLYLRVLAAKKERKELLSALSASSFPLLLRSRDEERLQGVAAECHTVDVFAEKLYSLLYPTREKEDVLL